MCQGRRPRRLRDLLPLRPLVGGLGRCRCGPESDPGVAALAAWVTGFDERRPDAVGLVFPIEPHFVLWCDLAGQTNRFDLLVPSRSRLDVRSLHVAPLTRIEGVSV